MDVNSMQVQALVAFLMPFVIQLMKRSQAWWLQWIDKSKPLICMATSFAAAVATSTGIALEFAPHTVTLHYPDAPMILRGLVTLLITFAAQHVFYGAFWKHVLPTPSNEVQKTVDSGQRTEPEPLTTIH